MASVKFLLRLAVTAGLLTLLFVQLGPQAILSRLHDFHAGPLLLAGIVLIAQYMVIVWRWKRIVDHVSPQHVSYWDLCRYFGASNYYGSFLPATVGGDLVRVGMLARQIGISQATASVLLDRLTGLVVLLGLALLMLPILALQIEQKQAALALFAAGFCAVLAFVALLFLQDRLASAGVSRLRARILAFGQHTRNALFDRRLAPIVVGGGLLIQFGSIMLVYLLGYTVGVSLGFGNCLLLVPPALLLASLPVSIAGWGVREGALAGGFALVGVPPADVVTVSILYGLTAPAIGAIYAVYALFAKGSDPPASPRTTPSGG
jgi:uncharacterized protein (TIRG00374 family)